MHVVVLMGSIFFVPAQSHVHLFINCSAVRKGAYPERYIGGWHKQFAAHQNNHKCSLHQMSMWSFTLVFPPLDEHVVTHTCVPSTR